MAFKAAYQLEALSNKKKEKRQNRKGKRRYDSHNAMPLHALVKSKNLKKMDIDELIAQLGGNMQELKKQLHKYYQQGHSKAFEDLDDIADLFTHKKFVKAFTAICKEDDTIDPLLAFTISELYLKKVFQDEQKALEKYLKVIAAANEEEIKKIKSALKISKVDALLVILIAQTYKGCPRKFVRDRAHQVTNTLYDAIASEDLEIKQIRKALKTIYGRNLNEFLLQALLEYGTNRDNLSSSEHKEAYDLVTEFVLNELNRMDNDERRQLLKEYTKARRNNAHKARRVNFINIDGEEYRGIRRTVDRLTRNGISRDLLN